MPSNFQEHFDSFKNRIWLNSGGEGALPVIAHKKLEEAISWKMQPFELTNQRFVEVPLGLKQSLAQLINVDYNDIILGNSASYGLHILANGIDLKKGDEVLLMQNDFPANIVPWLALENKGIKVKQIKARQHILEPQEIAEHITNKTKVVCLSHVHTFSGHIFDIQKISKLCRDKNIICIFNIVHSLGNRPIDLKKLHVDAIVGVGYKWLCGPYSTGFCWINPDLRKKLVFNQAYWQFCLEEKELKTDVAVKYREIFTSKKYDMFGTANFFNYVPWKASIDLLLSIGIENIQLHNMKLIDEIIQGLSKDKFFFISPTDKLKRSNLIVVSHKDPVKNQSIFDALLKNGIYTTVWKGNIRITPHLYNTSVEIQKLIAVLNQFK